MPNTRIDDILERLHALQDELETEIDRRMEEKRERFRYTLEQGKVRFEQGMKALQKRQRTGVWRYLAQAKIRHVLSAPVVYSLLVPLSLLDLAVTLYQQICFRLYGIPLVRRSDYLIIDRHLLPYLNVIEKLHCVYCGYANGIIEYCREIAARTEQYWCPIKHAKRPPDQHQRSERFVDYGDAENYRKRLQSLRNEWDDLKQDRSDS